MPKRPPGLAIAPPTEEVHHPTGDAARCEPMSHVDAHISIGSWRDMTDASRLKDLGFTHILNVAREVDPNNHCDLSVFRTMHIPLVDAYNEDLFQRLEEACAFIHDAVSLPSGKVLVHCRRGISRSPTMVVAYFMRFQGLAFDESLALVASKRECISLNMSFREALSHYHPEASKDTHLMQILRKEEEERLSAQSSPVLAASAQAASTTDSSSIRAGHTPAEALCGSNDDGDDDDERTREEVMFEAE